MVSAFITFFRLPQWRTACLFMFSLLASPVISAAPNISATIDQNPVLLGNSFILEIHADESIDPDDWDNSGLQDNFVVGRTSSQSQTSITNGSFNRSTTLSTLLVAKSAGVFIIPAFEFEGGKSKPIKVTVIDPNNGNSKSDTNEVVSDTTSQQQDIDLKVSISTDNIYVGQQFIYTSKLYIHQNTQMQSGNLTNPEVKNATIKQIGKDENSSEIINGRRFQTITRQYAMTLNQSGQNLIRASRFEGQISSYRPGYRFATTKPVVIQGKNLSINVKAQPSNYQGDWFVSDFVQINEEFQPEQQEYKVGEPITRTITLTAANVDKSVLPLLEIIWPSTTKVYPDKPEQTNFVQQGQSFAQQIDSFAIIPLEAGEIVLPEVSIPWFNSSTNRQEWAKLPARTINVIAEEATLPTVTEVASTEPTTPVKQSDASLWQWLTALFAILWLATIAVCVYLYRQKPRSSQITASSTKPDKMTDAWPQLKKALNANNAEVSYTILQVWFKQQWPSLTNYNLESLPLDAKSKLAYTELTDALFSHPASKERWQGSKLLQYLTQFRKQKLPVQKQDTVVQKLNP